MKKKGWLIAGGVLAALGGLVLALAHFNETNIIYTGTITALHFLRVLSFVLLGVGGCAAIVGGVRLLRQYLQAKKEIEEQKKLEAPVEIPSLYLEGGRLNEAELRSYTVSLFSQVEPDLIPYLEAYQAQMDRMNSYQARLARLLQMNGASDLKETELLLDKLEQSMFSNLRKAFNWIEMRDSTQEGRAELFSRLDAVRAENEGMLSKAGEFCSTLTEYINSQGDNPYSAVVFDSFMKSLQEQLEEV